MTELLLSADQVSLESDIENRLIDLGERLDQSLEDSLLLGGLWIRRRDCQDALTFAVEHPEAARQLCPILLNILGKETNRNYGHSGDELFLRGPSTEIQLYISAIINRISDNKLLDEYENSDFKVESLVSNLVNGIINGATPKVRGINLVSLGKIVRARPELTSTHIIDKSVLKKIIDTTVRLANSPITVTEDELTRYRQSDRHSISQFTVLISQEGPRVEIIERDVPTAGLLIVAAVASRNPGQNIIDEEIISSLPRIRTEEYSFEYCLSVLISECAKEEIFKDTFPIVYPFTNITSDDEVGSNDTALLGELIGIQPNSNHDQIRSLQKLYREKQRTLFAKLLGICFVLREKDLDLSSELKRHASTATDIDKDAAAEALGTLLIIEENAENQIVESLTKSVIQLPENRWNHVAHFLGKIATARALGEADRMIDISLEKLNSTPRISPRISIGDSPIKNSKEIKEIAATAIGLVTVERNDVELNNSLDEFRVYIQSTSGAERRRLAAILGKILTRYSSENESKIYFQIRRSSGNDRNELAEMLGEATAAKPQSEIGEISQAFRKRIRHETGTDRRLSAIMLGEIETARYFNPEDDLFETFAERIHTNRGQNRARASQVLGETAAITMEGDEEEILSHFANVVLNSSGVKRQRASKILGEAIAIKLRKDDHFIEVLQRWVKNTKKTERSEFAKILGELVAAGCESSVSKEFRPLQNQLTTTEGEESRRAARVLGELCAIGSNDSDAITALENKINSRTGAERELMCELLGEAAIMLDVAEKELPDRTYKHYQNILSDNRSQGAYMLGEIIVALRNNKQNNNAQIQRLGENVRKGNNREQSAILLGEIIAISDRDISDGIYESIKERISSTVGPSRALSARALGELLAWNDRRRVPTIRAIESILVRIYNIKVRDRDLTKILWHITSYGGVSAKEFINAVNNVNQVHSTVTNSPSQIEPNLGGFLSLPDPQRNYFLKALNSAISNENADIPVTSIRKQLQAFLTQVQDTSLNVRLTIIDILAKIDEMEGPSSIPDHQQFFE